MIKLRIAIALASAGLLGTACAATDDGHAHQHSTGSGHGHAMMKNGASAPMTPMAGATAAGTDKMMMADGKAGMAMTDGQVKRINKKSKKITIKHGEIKNLEMPPMTMVFRVADEAMLEAVKKGDKVMFHVEDKDGAMVITEIKPVK